MNSYIHVHRYHADKKVFWHKTIVYLLSNFPKAKRIIKYRKERRFLVCKSFVSWSLILVKSLQRQMEKVKMH